MKWVTRERPKTDRIACPWLIKHFIDPQAEFLYVPTEEVLEVAEREGAHSYDAPNAEYTHRDGLCSFEVLLDEYTLDEPALQLLARIVHGADVADDRDATPQSRGLLAVAEGFHLLNLGDHRQLELSLPAISRAVDGLVHRGLATRTEDEEDRRIKRVLPTKEAEQLVARLIDIRFSQLGEFVDSLTPRERNKLAPALAVLAERDEIAELLSHKETR